MNARRLPLSTPANSVTSKCSRKLSTTSFGAARYSTTRFLIVRSFQNWPRHDRPAADLRLTIKDDMISVNIIDNRVDKIMDKPAKQGGLKKGLTNYGDEGFSLFLRKAFIKTACYTDDALSPPIMAIANTCSAYNSCHGN